MDNIPDKKIKYAIFFILLIILICVFSQGLTYQSRNQPLSKDNRQESEYEKKYDFSKDWFSQNIPVWEKILSRFKGKSNIHYLEIGVYEGRSVIWMLENILTHNTAKLTCIDPLPGDLKIKFFTNLKKSGFADKVKTILGYSQIELKRLYPNSFDFIYIDGNHTADDVLADAVLCWPLLKDNGILIFDDYLLTQDLPIELRPQFAIDAFITTHRNFLELIHQEYQVIVEKRRAIINDKFVFPIGQYVYSWREKKLFHSDPFQLIELSDKEKELIEILIKSRKFGKAKFSPDEHLLKDEDFSNLLKRLELDLRE